MNLESATKYARHLFNWLLPVSERILVTGSIRRERPECADVDLCLIPKLTVYRDMFQVEQGVQNHVWMFLNSYVNDYSPADLKPGQQLPCITAGSQPEGRRLQRMTVTLPACQLDIWFAHELNWANKVLQSTGSVEHNIWLAQRATERGLHWYVSEGLCRQEDIREHKLSQHPQAPRQAREKNLILPATDEVEFYSHLGLAYIDPKNREAAWLSKNIDSGLP